MSILLAYSGVGVIKLFIGPSICVLSCNCVQVSVLWADSLARLIKQCDGLSHCVHTGLCAGDKFVSRQLCKSYKTLHMAITLCIKHLSCVQMSNLLCKIDQTM